MNQDEIDNQNRGIVEEFLRRIAPGEIIAVVVTLPIDGKGLGWYPAEEKNSATLLDLLRQKPAKVFIDRIEEGRHRPL